MIAYLDTSALIKKYVSELGSSYVVGLWNECETVATSVVAFSEAMAAFHRRMRESPSSEPVIESAIRSFRREWQDLARVAVSDDVNTRIEPLVRRHPLRGFDAIHLASALVLRGGRGTDFAFVCADERLAAAAKREGLALLPESWS